MDNLVKSLPKTSEAEPYSHRAKVQAELVKLLYQQARTVLLGLIATATITAIIFYNKIPNKHILIWIVIVYALTLIRYLSVRQFKSHEITPAETIKWGWKFAFFAFLSGCTWGAASIVFFTPDNPQLFIILTLIIIGLTITSMAALSAFLWAYYAYAIPAMLPLVWQYIHIGHQEYFIFGILILVFIITLFPFARVNHRTLRQSITLRFENVDLIHQLTEQKEKAEQAKHDAEEANVAKTKFLAAASHDLRQPLHAMGLFLSALDDRLDKTDQKTIVHKIQKSSAALGGLLDSLLDISKLDAGVVKVEHRHFNIQSLFDTLRHEFEPYASEKNLRLSFVTTSLWANCDYRILDRIVRNLISNAIKYTDKGGIVVGCRRHERQALLAVYDTGIGIPNDKMDEIFLEFHQLQNPERDRSKGLGLGLAIVKRMAKLLHAPVLTTSIPGKGSMFGLLLPRVDAISQTKTITKRWQNQQSLVDKVTLIVDDEAEIRDSLTVLLQSWKCRVIAVASGSEALNELAKNNLRPDIILADYRLRDDEQGTDVIHSIHGLYSDSTIPAIIITGDTAPDRIKEAEASGYKIIHKPVPADKLRALIAYALFHNSSA